MKMVDWAKVLSEVKRRSRNGKISCRTALKLADELGVPPKSIGKAANELKIKIRACQLGCFK